MQRYWGDRITGIVCIGLSFFFGYLALDFPAEGGTFPLFAAGGTVVLSLFLIGESFFKKDPEHLEKIKINFSYEKIKPLLLILVTFVYVLAIFELGYFSSSILFLLVATLLVGIRNYKAILLTAIILFPAMYAFFVFFLKAELPGGILF
ncbi:MAG: tripartite tricarboxylate transporter TctB family protein [SAR324 cluster bacterium]|nr:tripartite tricarboxylate transporter TctB family protein [SAR324 cluster bacterium]